MNMPERRLIRQESQGIFTILIRLRGAAAELQLYSFANPTIFCISPHPSAQNEAVHETLLVN
jgi:hypothetical protein